MGCAALLAVPLLGGRVFRAASPAPCAASVGTLPLLAVDPVESIEHTIKRGETLASIFTGYGISAGRAIDCYRSLLALGLPALIPGDSLVLRVRNDRTIRDFSLLNRLECWYNLSVDSLAVNGHRSSVGSASYLCLLRGTLSTSIAEALAEMGEGGALTAKITDLFAWDVNFFLDPRKGDSFAILVVKRYAAGRFVGYGDILAAQYVNEGRVHTALGLVDSAGRLQHYDETGQSVQKTFLKAPLSYSRISSRFSYHRRHPILGIVRPHLGIDYAAPYGTPVCAAADGVVTCAGVENGLGRVVRIRHGGSYETTYGHLQGFAGGTRTGRHVKQGDLIATVGSSGLSTGPHLDYRMTIGGRYVNPMTISAPSKAGISDADRAAFDAARTAHLGLIDKRFRREGVYVVEISEQPPSVISTVNKLREQGNDRS